MPVFQWNVVEYIIESANGLPSLRTQSLQDDWQLIRLRSAHVGLYGAEDDGTCIRSVQPAILDMYFDAVHGSGQLLLLRFIVITLAIALYLPEYLTVLSLAY